MSIISGIPETKASLTRPVAGSSKTQVAPFRYGRMAIIEFMQKQFTTALMCPPRVVNCGVETTPGG
jgi:hypothetical protein